MAAPVTENLAADRELGRDCQAARVAEAIIWACSVHVTDRPDLLRPAMITREPEPAPYRRFAFVLGSRCVTGEYSSDRYRSSVRRL